MDLRQLECFFAVADELHFGRAAARLNLGQPTVSEAVRRLESALGGRLFHRSSRQVSLTPLGMAFLQPARDAYAGLRDAYADAVRLAAGTTNTLTIGYVEDLAQPLLASVPGELRKRHPDVFVLPIVLPTLLQAEAVRNGQIDLGLGWDTPASPGTRRSQLTPDPYVIIVPSSDPLAGQRNLTPAQVAARPLVMWPRDVNPAHRERFTDWLTAQGQTVHVAHEAQGTSNIITHVLAGLGLGVTTQSVAATKHHHGIVYRALGPTGPCAARTLVTGRDTPRQALRTLTTLLKVAAAATQNISDEGDRDGDPGARRLVARALR